jgi:hypothetical protein
VLTAAFGETHHHCAIATRMLARYQSEPGRHMAAVLEVGAVANRRYHGSRRFRPDSSNLRNPLTNRAGFEDLGDLAIEGLDAIVDLEHDAYKLETISRVISVSSSLGVARIFGISRRARVADTPIAIPRSSRSPRIWLISADR